MLQRSARLTNVNILQLSWPTGAILQTEKDVILQKDRLP